MLYKCRCGKQTEQLKTYFRKGDTVRVTLCEDCAATHGLDEKDKDGNNIYDSVVYAELTKEQKIKLPPNYAS